MIEDEDSTKASASTNIFWGDLIALSVSPLFAIYYEVNAKNIQILPAFVVLGCINVIMLAFLIPITICYLDFNLQSFLSFDEKIGLLGWASQKYFLVSILVIGPIVGILAGGSYSYVLVYFPPEITGNIFLLEPFFAQIFGLALGLDNFP